MAVGDKAAEDAWQPRLGLHLVQLFQRMIGRRVGMIGYRTDDALRLAPYHPLKRLPFRSGIGHHGAPDTQDRILG